MPGGIEFGDATPAPDAIRQFCTFRIVLHALEQPYHLGCDHRTLADIGEISTGRLAQATKDCVPGAPEHVAVMLAIQRERRVDITDRPESRGDCAFQSAGRDVRHSQIVQR